MRGQVDGRPAGGRALRRPAGEAGTTRGVRATRLSHPRVRTEFSQPSFLFGGFPISQANIYSLFTSFKLGDHDNSSSLPPRPHP